MATKVIDMSLTNKSLDNFPQKSAIEDMITLKRKEMDKKKSRRNKFLRLKSKDQGVFNHFFSTKSVPLPQNANLSKRSNEMDKSQLSNS